MAFKRVLLAIAVLAVLSACTKKKIDDYPDFIGLWTGDNNGVTQELFVEEDGRATYREYKPGEDVTSAGVFKLDEKEDVLNIDDVEFI